jgi:tryptophan synthase alpha chain
MSATAAAIDKALGEGRAAFLAYLPIGYPTLPGSIEAIRAVIDAGTDIVEVGLPYSDPVMDGPVIQAAGHHALAGGTRVRDLFTVLEQTAGRGGELVVMTYWNLVHYYGVDAFARDLAAAGGAGIITPDLIPDEAGEWLAAAETYDLDRIFLVAPSSTTQRLALTARATRGFIYAASTMGVTGERESVGTRAKPLVERTRAAGAQRVCVGIGVSTPEQAHEVAAYADGVIVGSTLIRALNTGGIAALTEAAADMVSAVSRS